MTNMHNPPHPGETLREDILPALGITITYAAQQLGVTRSALSRVLNEHAAISPEMALRLESWLGVENGGRADVWLAQQTSYDLWQVRKSGAPKVASLDEKILFIERLPKGEYAVRSAERSSAAFPTQGQVQKSAAIKVAYRNDKKIFVERRPEGDYAVRKANSERASAVLPTQAEAIERARELSNGASPLVERVRNTTGGKPDKWRKA